MAKFVYFSPTVRSSDPKMRRALAGWLGLYEFNYMLARSWDGGRHRMERLAKLQAERVAEDAAAFGLQSADAPTPERLYMALACGAKVLNETGAKYVVGGGMAANYHGQERSTRDVDFFICDDHEHLDPLLEALKRRDLRPHRFELPSFMPPDALFWWVPLQFGLPDAAPVNVDLLVARHEFMAFLHATGIESETNGVRVRILGPEALLVLKLQAFRPKDQWDAMEVWKANPGLDRALLEAWVKKFKLEERLAQIERELKEHGGRRFG